MAEVLPVAFRSMNMAVDLKKPAANFGRSNASGLTNSSIASLLGRLVRDKFMATEMAHQSSRLIRSAQLGTSLFLW